MIVFQSLFFQLRTNREELASVRTQFLRQAEARRAATAGNGANGNDLSADLTVTGIDVDMSSPSFGGAPTPLSNSNLGPQIGVNGQMGPTSGPQTQAQPRHPWEYVEETASLLKTSFPLLALTLETIGDQIQARMKPGPDEDVYRIITALSNDALQVSLTLD